jgi:hypothetical protein
MLGMLRQAQALESRAAAVKLGILRSLVRDDDQPLPGGGYHGDLPEGWTKSLTHEVALTLSLPAVTADTMMWAAWDLQARLPGTGDLLAAGVLTYAKAKAVREAFLLLSDQDAARAEQMILPELADKTYGQVKRLAEQAALTADPQAAARRREHAERHNARVTMFREDSGAVALSGRDLPTDQTLAAHAHVCARAQQYKDSGAFPSGTRMDQFRSAAYLDLLNSKPAEERITSGQLEPVARTTGAEADTPDKADARSGHVDDRVPGSGQHSSCARGTGSPEAERVSNGPSGTGSHGDGPDGDGPDGDGPAGDQSGDGPGDHGPGGGHPGSPGSPGGVGPADVTPPRLTDLVLPLATLLGLAERPGESHGFGPLDPDLCRQLAIASIGSPWTRLCVTVTDAHGIAVGHGCAKTARSAKTRPAGPAGQPANPGPGTRTSLALPAEVNLTITNAQLAELARRGPPGARGASRPSGQPPWSFTRFSDSGPPGGYRTWLLTLPDGRQFLMALEAMPTYECNHHHESRAYQPNDRLRHLVQVRDYTCTFPPCNRHARESDWEHAIPYDKGGRTCSCNAGARSRACHQIKQTTGWKVTQPRPGWHRWETPSGRIYTQSPKHYPA